MKITVIRDLAELETLRPYWEHSQYHPNSDFAQFQLVCQLRPQVLSPHVTSVQRDGEPSALLAARLEATHFTPSIGYFNPVRIPAKILTVIYQGLIGDIDDEIAQQLVHHIWTVLARGEADAVVFHQLSEHSPLLRALLVHGPKFFCEKMPIWSTHRAVTLPEEPGFLLKTMRSKHRSWIRGRYSKLEEAFPGKVSWRWMQHFNDVPALCDGLEQVAHRTYQRGLGAGFVNNEEHRQRFQVLASRGQLRVQLLEIEGQIQAFWVGTVYKGVFHSSETGYVPDLRVYEPGTLVFLQLVDELVKEGVRRLDFGLGDASYKERFGDECWREATLRLFAPTFKGFYLKTMLGLSRILDSATRGLLQKTGLLDRLKTGWRRRLTSTRPEAKKK